MTKLEINKELAERTGLPLADATKVADAFCDILKDAFSNGEDIFLRGFGSFRVVDRKAKVVQNIKEGTSVILPARKAVKFILSKSITIKQ